MNLEALEKLYDKNDVSDLALFLNSFNSVNELIQFIHNRPRAPISIYIENVDAGNDIIMVVPTPDFKDNRTQQFIKNFRDYKIIFVVSSGIYFNFSISMNAGIQEALKFNPEWIGLSNVDISPITNTSQIRPIIRSHEPSVLIPRIFLPNGKKQRCACLIRTGKHVNYVLRKLHFLSKFLPVELRGQFLVSALSIARKHEIIRYMTILNRYQEPYTRLHSIFLKIFFSIFHLHTLCFTNIQPISFVHSVILREYKFDEDFINGGEDTELSIRMLRNGVSFREIEYDVAREVGVYLGKSEVRLMRNSVIEVLVLGTKLNDYDFAFH